ncbi:uncharacterized protein LOC141592524 [Silene latifolia]|uniref:uncharacterized protein LOC141592524 n=1 Tax=Silene latifolia TaxID=37657 RepID=UPI003D76F415
MDPDHSDQKPAPRKLRFQPKRQPPRVIKRVAPKIEATDDAESPERKELMRRFQESLSAKPRVVKKVESDQVAFGYGSAMPSRQYSGSIPSYYEDKANVFNDEKDFKEPWSYYSYYPTTLPLRRPYSGNPETLNAEEFGRVSTFDESNTNLARELGLMDENSDSRMLFFQIPTTLPMTKRATSAAGEASASNSKPANGVDRPCGFKELKTGLMGKVVVYKSGAVKLKLGDTQYDVTPGSDCGFAQDAVVVNTQQKHWCVTGEISKHVILTPDVDSILDSFADLG